MKIEIPKEISEELETLKSKISSIRKEIGKLSKEEQELDNQLFSKKFKCALTCGVFSEDSWIMNDYYKDSLTLISHTNNHKILSKFFQTDYHCDIVLEEGVRMHFSDWDIYLVFENSEKAKSFIRKYNLQINTSSLEKSINECEEKLKSLNKFLQKIKELC